MTAWKEKLISLFVPDIKPVTIAYDEDRLLSEESIITALKDKGFQVVLTENLVQVRFEFEEFLRKLIRREGSRNLLLLHQKESDFSLPYDIVRCSLEKNVSYDNLFPNLSVSVLKTLSSEQLDDLAEAYDDEKPSGELGHDGTCLFLLKNLFRIHPQELKTDSDLMVLLLEIHFRGIRVPREIGDFTAKYMSGKKRFLNWNALSDLITDSSRFWSYLQKVWDNTLTDTCIDVSEGPSRMDFTKREISVFIDDAFEMGYLRLTEVDPSAERPDWIPENLFEMSKRKDSKDLLNQERKNKLARQLKENVPSEDSSLSEWISYQRAYSEYMGLSLSEDRSDVFSKANSVFAAWLKKHYDALSFETSRTPVMLPRVVDYLKKIITDSKSKVALIVLDGMSYSQWITVRNELSSINHDFVFDENTSFACIPTLTSVSRQAIFSGVYPRLFGSTILTTADEPKLWAKAWKDVCIPLYMKNNGIGKAEEVLNEIVPNTRVVGIVINTIDDLMHNTILGTKEFYERIRIWMGNHFLVDLITGLMDMGFGIWVTADHGNIEAEGTGSIKTGKLAESRGSRTYILPSDTLRDQFVKESTHAFAWNSSLLPDEGFSVLIAEGSSSFSKSGEKGIVHGGISIDEVMVPFVKIGRKKDE